MNPLLFLLTATILSLSSTNGRAEPVTPPFFRFHTSERYSGQVAKPILRTKMDREYRTRLNLGAQQPVNFAGHYVLTVWGCGAGCLMGAILDARNGTVNWLPFTVCCGRDDDAEPIEFRPDSTLLVIRGMRNEQGANGTFYYRYEQDSLKLIDSQPQAKN